MHDDPLIEIQNATIFRGDTCVFKNFTLTIRQHEPTAILGPNGSGKTTLLKVINRELYPAQNGDSMVRILGRERWNVWNLRSHIGVVSHDLHARYNANTTGVEVVLSGFLSSVGIHGQLQDRIDKVQIARASRVLVELGIADLADVPLRRMSTGQQRRCLLGRALVHDPHTLILDEPTAGLDLAGSFDYLDRICRLATAGKNIVLVTHNLNEIPPPIGRIIMLRAGTIVADGARNEVLTEKNLQLTFGTRVRIAKIDGYCLAYPPESDIDAIGAGPSTSPDTA